MKVPTDVIPPSSLTVLGERARRLLEREEECCSGVVWWVCYPAFHIAACKL